MAHIILECENCRRPHLFDKEELDCGRVNAMERRMGTEVAYEGSIEVKCDCSHDIGITHRRWEYPEGVENGNETEVSGATLVENML
jgi:hypothetical protein